MSQVNPFAPCYQAGIERESQPTPAPTAKIVRIARPATIAISEDTVILDIGGISLGEVIPRDRLMNRLSRVISSDSNLRPYLMAASRVHVITLQPTERSQAKPASLNRPRTEFQQQFGRRESAVQSNSKHSVGLLPKIDEVIDPAAIAAIEVYGDDQWEQDGKVVWSIRSVGKLKTVDPEVARDRAKQKNTKNAIRLRNYNVTGETQQVTKIGIIENISMCPSGSNPGTLYLQVKDDRLYLYRNGSPDPWGYVRLSRTPVHDHMWMSPQYPAIASWMNIQQKRSPHTRSMPGEDPRLARSVDATFPWPPGTSHLTHKAQITSTEIKIIDLTTKRSMTVANLKTVRNGCDITLRERIVYAPNGVKFDGLAIPPKFWTLCEQALAKQARKIGHGNERDRHSHKQLCKTVRKTLERFTAYSVLSDADLRTIAANVLSSPFMQGYNKTEIVGMCRSKPDLIKFAADKLR